MTGRMRASRVGLVGALLASSFVIGCTVEDEPENDPGVEDPGAGGWTVVAPASAPGELASGLTVAQAANLQQRVDDVLADIPGGRQVSATEISYDGLTVTFDPLYSEDKAALAPGDIICSGGWFCIIVRGTTFSFFKCQTWSLSNWWGNSPFKNNQTSGTVARFYDQSGIERWSNRAYSDGYVDVTPFWWFRPC